MSVDRKDLNSARGDAQASLRPWPKLSSTSKLLSMVAASKAMDTAENSARDLSLLW